MLLKENPFYILEVDSMTSKGKIMDAVEDKSFDDPDKEDIYNNAADILLNPHKRITAEMSWFLGMSYQDIPKPTNDLKLLTHFPNIIAQFVALMNSLPKMNIQSAVTTIIKLDELYTHFRTAEIMQLINHDRKVAGITLVQDEHVIQSEFKTLQEDVHQATKELIKNFSRPVYSRMANEIAETVVAKKYIIGNILNQFFDIYELDMSKYIDEENKKIRNILQHSDYHTDSFLTELSVPVHKISSMTKAECILADAKGTSNFGKSIETFSMIYDKNFDIYNDTGNSIISYKLLLLLKECFPIIAKNPKFEENLQFLREKIDTHNSDISQSVASGSTLIYENAKKALEEILEQIRQIGHFEEGYEQQNKEFLYGSFERSYVHIVEEFLQRQGYTYEENISIREYAALIYALAAKLYILSNDFNKAAVYIQKSYEQVQHSRDEELKENITNMRKQFLSIQNSNKKPVSRQVNRPVRRSKDSQYIQWGIVVVFVLIGLSSGGLIGGIISFFLGCWVVDKIFG